MTKPRRRRNARRLLSANRLVIDSLRIGVGRRDPVFRMATKLGLGPISVFLLFLVLFVLLKAVLIALQGNLLTDHLSEVAANDQSGLSIFGLGRWVTSTVSVLFPHSTQQVLSGSLVGWAGRNYSAENVKQASEFVPYLRDYVDILMLTAVSMHLALVVRHWPSLHELPGRLVDSGYINKNSPAYAGLVDTLRRHDRAVGRARNEWLFIAGSVLMAGAIYLLINRFGIYPPLVRAIEDQGGSASQSQLVAGWWAYYKVSPCLLTYQIAVISIALYYICKHNYVGLKIITLFWTIQNDNDHNQSKPPLLFINPSHVDRYGGLGPIRDVLFTVHACILIGVFVVSLLPLYLPDPIRWVVILIALSGSAYILSHFLFLPIKMLNASMARRKHAFLVENQTRRNHLLSVINNTTRYGWRTRLRIAAIESEYEIRLDEAREAEKMNTKLFPLSWMLLYIATCIVPFVFLVMQIVKI